MKKRSIVCLTTGRKPIYAPSRDDSVNRQYFHENLMDLIKKDKFDTGFDYSWSTAIQAPDHNFNWAGVALGMCNLLLKGKLKFSRRLLRKIPKEWQPELVKCAILRASGVKWIG